MRPAELRWRALETFDGATLVEVRPSTGFLHQIRAIFAELGHPLAGDRAYGPPSDATGAARHMLHASEIAVDEIRTVSKVRLGDKIGSLSKDEAAALRRVITEMYGE